MARLAGVDLPREKRVEIGLTYIYGIGLSSSQKILKAANVNPDTRVKDLTDDQVQAIRKAMDGYKVEGDLRREVALNIKRLTEIGCYRGLRPVSYTHLRKGKEVKKMSRIGNKPINIPDGVEVKLHGHHITVKGPKGTLERDLHKNITVIMQDKVINVTYQTLFHPL